MLNLGRYSLFCNEVSSLCSRFSVLYSNTKDGRSLKLLSKIDTIVFDKTGALTMRERTRRVNVQWTFKRVNRKAGGLAQRAKESVQMMKLLFCHYLIS